MKNCSNKAKQKAFFQETIFSVSKTQPGGTMRFKMINLESIKKSAFGWKSNKPFPHLIVDNFFELHTAQALEKEFPKFEDKRWHEYGNPVEIKKACNNWNVFPKLTYQVFSFLNSTLFVNKMSQLLFGSSILTSDPGLNGGGWHIHGKGGKLNTHLDYSLHPKLGLQRKVNIIVYLNSNWQPSWGGNLGFWDNKSDTHPGKLKKQIEPLFNRAIIFDTTCNSWHGLPDLLNCPKNEFRKSLAVYYLTKPPKKVNTRGKALFAPTDKQKNDSSVHELIKLRANTDTAAATYKL